MSQGFGGTEGVGALVDGAGDDTYYCDPGDPATGGHTLYIYEESTGVMLHYSASTSGSASPVKTCLAAWPPSTSWVGTTRILTSRR